MIIPRRPLADARLYLDQGWFQAMTLNGITPQPGTESASGPWQVWDFGSLQAGTPFSVWISWQVNPTNVGAHAQDVALYDRNARLMLVRRDITVFP